MPPRCAATWGWAPTCRAPTSSPSTEFAADVRADTRLRDLNGHWRLQRHQIFFDDLPMTRFGRIETFAEDAPRLFSRIFGPDRYILRDAVTLNPANASGNRKNKPALPDAARADVAAAYVQDSEMLAEIARRPRP